MFGIGMQELVLICAIALVVVGPKQLPEIARALGKGYAEFRRAFEEMKRNVEEDIDASELRRSLLDLPPPPPPAMPTPPPQESLLTVAPAPQGLPYPENVAAPAAPPDDAATAGAAGGAAPDEAERDRG